MLWSAANVHVNLYKESFADIASKSFVQRKENIERVILQLTLHWT